MFIHYSKVHFLIQLKMWSCYMLLCQDHLTSIPLSSYYSRAQMMWPLDNSHILVISHNHYLHNCMLPHRIHWFNVWVIRTLLNSHKIVAHFCANYLGSTVRLTPRWLSELHCTPYTSVIIWAPLYALHLGDYLGSTVRLTPRWLSGLHCTPYTSVIIWAPLYALHLGD